LHLRAMGMTKHLWHHVHTNDPRLDPDWGNMSWVTWVRRHSSAAWMPCHLWQCWYWLATTALVEPAMELSQVACASLAAVGALLEPPKPGSQAFGRRLEHALATWTEVTFNPAYQLAAFLVQPFWRQLGTLLLARGVSRLVLYPFSEVQHYMPEHYEAVGQETSEWVVGQLLSTANLKFGSRLAWWMDFLMFHGDSHQIEHHLWPAMSFVRYGQAAQVVRRTCAELGLPYHEVSYWEGYRKIWQQVSENTAPSVPVEPVIDAKSPSRDRPGGERKRPRPEETSSSDEESSSVHGPCPVVERPSPEEEEEEGSASKATRRRCRQRSECSGGPVQR
ncbi:unnamed protein product, partial [Polarella glacialis]